MVKNWLGKLSAVLVAMTLALTGCGGSAETASQTGDGDQVYKIGINQYMSHPSLDAAVTGFKQAIAESGIQVEYDEQNSQADQATASSIANKFASADLDLVLAVATPTAQATVQVITDIPVLFTAVTDPVASDLVASLDQPGSNVSGTSDLNPVADQIALVKRVAPDAKTVGIVYSSGEINSAVQVELAKEAAAKEGLEVVEKTITASAEVLQAVQTLDVDAIYIPTDNNVVGGLDSVLQVAEAEGIPVIAGETDSVKNGALITYGLDYTQLGYQTGEMAIKILTEGADPATMPVETQKTLKLIVNTTAAERMGITLAEDLLDEADEKVS